MLSVLAVCAGVALIVLSLWDAFETVILPRSVVRLVRLSRTINALVWPVWYAIAARAKTEARRERYRSFYGPMSIIFMLAIWAAALLLGFALVAYGTGSAWTMAGGRAPGFIDDIYVSGTTLFTLGLGDVVPAARVTRVLLVIEVGIGLGFLTVGIAYLPVINQSFSRREAQITVLDAWAGSPPSAVELLRRLSANDAVPEIQTFLRDWERWTAELLESHISYPQVAYFRSQHGRQSWVSALTAVLDASSLVLTGIEGVPSWRARQAFAIARHAAVDLSQLLNAPPRKSPRLESFQSDRILAAVEATGLRFTQRDDAGQRLLHYRKMYEPYVAGLSAALAMDLPGWIRDGTARDNWESTPKADVEKHL